MKDRETTMALGVWGEIKAVALARITAASSQSHANSGVFCIRTFSPEFKNMAWAKPYVFDRGNGLLLQWRDA
jgi:hypothetical protein